MLVLPNEDTLFDSGSNRVQEPIALHFLRVCHSYLAQADYIPEPYFWSVDYDDPAYRLAHTMGFRASDSGKGRPVPWLQEREHHRDKLEERAERKQRDEEEAKNMQSRPAKLQKFFEKPPEPAREAKGRAKGSVEPIAHNPGWQGRWQSWSDWVCSVPWWTWEQEPSWSAWEWGWHAR